MFLIFKFITQSKILKFAIWWKNGFFISLTNLNDQSKLVLYLYLRLNRIKGKNIDSSYSNRNTISKHVRLLWIFFLNWSGNVFYNNKRGSVLWRRWCLAILGILDLQIHLNRLFSPTNLSNAMFLLRVSWTCSSRKQCQQTRLFGFFVHCFVLSSNA